MPPEIDLQLPSQRQLRHLFVDAVSQAVETEILKLAQAQSVGVAQKLIKMNVETVVGVFQDEQMGKIIDLYV